MALFFTSVQKYGGGSRPRSAGASDGAGTTSGEAVDLVVGLESVETIQKTGKTMTTKSTIPTAFQPSAA